MSRATTKAEVAERFACLLKKTVPDFDDRLYWVIGNRPPADAILDQELITFCFVGGQYDYGAQVGGVLPYQGTIRISLWAWNYSDESGSDRELLLADATGLYRIQGQLLKIFDNCLEDDDSEQPDKDALLTEGIKVLSDDEQLETSFDDDGDSKVNGLLSMSFGVDFLWDLNA